MTLNAYQATFALIPNALTGVYWWDAHLEPSAKTVFATPFAPATPNARLDSSAMVNTVLKNADSSSALKTQSVKKESAAQYRPNVKPKKIAKKDSTAQKMVSAKTNAPN